MKPLVRYIFCCLIFFVKFTHAQTDGQLIEESLDLKIPFTITQYTTKHGLPQSQVLDIIEKRNGNLIIATANGIVEYNGHEFISFIKDGIYKKSIYVKLFWNEESQMLFGQEIGGGLYQIYPFYKKIGNYSANCFFENLIIGITSEGTVYSTRTDSFNFTKYCETKIKNPKSIVKTKDEIYITSDFGIYKYNIVSKSIIKVSNQSTNALFINDFTKELYFFSGSKIFKKGLGGEQEVLDIGEGSLINEIIFIDSIECFVATTKGLYQIYEEYVDKYTQRSALPSQYIQSLYFSRNDNCLFVGTGEKGLLKLQFKSCYSFTAKQGFGENVSLSSIIRTSDEHTIISGYCCDLYKLGSDTVLPYSSVKNNFASLAEIRDTIYGGTWGDGISLIKNEELVGKIKGINKLPNDFVHAVFQDSQNNIWIGTSNGIAVGKNSTTLKPILTDKISGDIIAFYELKNNSICVGGSKGVFIINKKNKIDLILDEKDGLVGKEVRSFYEDKDGKLWIGTYGGGLYCYYKGKLSCINKMKNAQLSEDAFCLAYDDLGYFYLTSNHGLWRIKLQDLNDFYFGKKNYLVPFYYGEEEGVFNTEFNGGFQNNYLKTTYNHFYFPTLEGIVIVTPEQPVYRTLLPVINKVVSNDTLLVTNDTILDRETFSLEFNFSAVSFAEKNNLYYQYKLDGDKLVDWSPLQKETKVNFKLLPPGKYVFSVRAIDAFNDASPIVASFVFEIKPYFYETTIFQISLLLTLAGLTYLITRKRVINKRKKLKSEQRTGRLVAELELKALQAQMNPHFVFNSLNSIKYFLSTNDYAKADKYIDYFSGLIRKFLDYSNNSLIKIEDEAKMINSYLELEKMRLNNKFDFTILISPAVKNKNIPTFIIQPFIENSIKHGVAPSDKSCLIILKFSLEDNKIICIIDDTGIGREESQKMKLSPKAHKSKGIELVREKISIIEEIHDAHIEVKIIDKKENDVSTGTTIAIEIEDKL
jgi:hypothetical protein